MRRLLSMVMVVALAACLRAPEVQPTPERAIGVYSYRFLAGATLVDGQFSIEADKVALEARKFSCREVGAEFPHPAIHMFRCGGGSTAINVRINSSSPGMSTWNSMAPGQKEVVVCARYEWTDNGKQSYCAATRKEVRTELVRIGGALDIVQFVSAERP